MVSLLESRQPGTALQHYRGSTRRRGTRPATGYNRGVPAVAAIPRTAPHAAAIVRERLASQRLTGSVLREPREVVAWFGAVQAQDFPGARWAVALRTKGLTDAAVARAYDAGEILRTHVLRPTWHFVTSADIRWLIALTGPRLISRLAYRHRQLELDPPTVARSRAALIRALDADDLTRREIASVLTRARIRVTPERLGHLLALAELEGVVCSGPLRDRQITYALVERRAPRVPAIDEDEALARLAERYFTSHGPATAADFGWWSGLSVRDARRAIEAAGPALSRDARAGALHRSAARPAQARPAGSSAWLLPNYDEYLVAYKDRTAVLGNTGVDPRDALANTLIVGGVAAGAWRAARRNGSIAIALAPWRRLTRDDLDRVGVAARRYSAFIGQPVEIAR